MNESGVYVGVEDMNDATNDVEGGVPDTRRTAVKRSGGIIIEWVWLSLLCLLRIGAWAAHVDHRRSTGRWQMAPSRCQKSELS